METDIEKRRKILEHMVIMKPRRQAFGEKMIFADPEYLGEYRDTGSRFQQRAVVKYNTPESFKNFNKLLF